MAVVPLLPETIVAGQGGHIGDHQELHIFHNLYRRSADALWLPSDFLKTDMLGTADGVAQLDGDGYVLPLQLGEQGASPGGALTWDGTSDHPHWVPGGGSGVSDHGALTGLGDDDHPQYLTLARLNATDLRGPVEATVSLTDLHDVTGPFATRTVPVMTALGFLPTPLRRDVDLELHGNGACDAKLVPSGTISAATDPTLRTLDISEASAFDQFVSSDVNKRICIDGAGAAGATLRTTISTVVSSTRVTLANAATAAVTNKRVVWGTNNTSAINACIASLPIAGGSIFVRGAALYDSGVTLQGRRNVKFRGPHGLTGRVLSVSQGFDVVDRLPPSCLVFTGTTGTALNCDETDGFILDNVGLMYAISTYAGTLLSLRGNAGTPSLRTTDPAIMHAFVGQCFPFQAALGSKLVDTTRSWSPELERVTMYGGDIQLCCDNGEYVNDMTLSNTKHAFYRTVAIRNPGEGLDIYGVTAERKYGPAGTRGRGGALIDAGDGTAAWDAVALHGGWFSDTGDEGTGTQPLASSWIVAAPGPQGTALASGGLTLSGVRMGGGANQTIVQIAAAAFEGIAIVGGSATGGTILDGGGFANLKGEVRRVAISAGVTISTGLGGSGVDVDVSKAQ